MGNCCYNLIDYYTFIPPYPPRFKYNSFPDKLFWIPRHDSYPPIQCVLLPKENAELLMIVSHGNNSDLGTLYRYWMDYSTYWNINIILWEYPGYGYSNEISNNQIINRDLSRVIEFLSTELKWPLNRTILYGFSIGTGPTCELASIISKNESKQDFGGIILHGPFTSLKTLISQMDYYCCGCCFSLVSCCMYERWNNLEKIKNIKCPVLFIHGMSDNIVPFNHTEQLYEACPSRKMDIITDGSMTHNNIRSD